MKELVTQQVVEYLEGSLSAEDSKAMRAQLEVSPELRAQEQGMRRVLQAENLAAVSEAELPDAFEDAVMRRLRVAPPPQAHKNLGNLRSLLTFSRELLGSSYRFQAMLITTCSLLVMLAFSPSLRATLHQKAGMTGTSTYLAMYDAVRNERSARIINSVTARIPPGYRAVSMDVRGTARPGEHADVVWLTQVQSKSVSALIVQDVRVLSNEQDAVSDDDSVGLSTVTILVPAEDAAKIELARSTGMLVLSVRDNSNIDKNEIEEFIMRGGRLVPKA